MVGTPAYMSPEQAMTRWPGFVDTRKLSIRLAVVLYETLTGLLRSIPSAARSGLCRALRDQLIVSIYLF